MSDEPEAGPAFARALTLMRERERFVDVARSVRRASGQPSDDRDAEFLPSVLRYTRALRASGLPLERVMALVTSAIVTTFADTPDAGREVLETVVTWVFEEFEVA